MKKIERVYILCHAGDYSVAIIAVSSVRHWYPDLPITLVKDLTSGDFDTTEVELLWNVSTRILPVARCGWGLAKIQLLLNPRKERFLFLDADVLLWGQVLEPLETAPEDFVVSAYAPPQPVSDHVKQFYYDTELLKSLDPAFAYPGVVFNTGAFIGTSGLISQEAVEPFIEWSNTMRLTHPDVFSCGDQGLINYLLFKLQAKGVLSVNASNFMVGPDSPAAAEVSLEMIRQREGKPIVVHFYGLNTFSYRRFTKAEIVAFFEDRHYASTDGRLGMTARPRGRYANPFPWKLAHVCAYLEHHANGPLFALQLGAFDGISGDPLREFLVKPRWQALLLEPCPEPYTSLQTTYRDNPRVETRQCALSVESGVKHLYYVDPARYRNSWDGQISSFQRGHLEKHGISADAILSCKVEAITFDALMNQVAWDRIDVLQIDCEGEDWRLLRSFPFDRTLPAIIGIEIAHLSDSEVDDMIGFLTELGYQFQLARPDLIAVHPIRLESL